MGAFALLSPHRGCRIRGILAVAALVRVAAPSRDMLSPCVIAHLDAAEPGVVHRQEARLPARIYKDVETPTKREAMARYIAKLQPIKK